MPSYWSWKNDKLQEKFLAVWTYTCQVLYILPYSRYYIAVLGNHSVCLPGHCEKVTHVLVGWSPKQTQANIRVLLTKISFWWMSKQVTHTSTSEWKCSFEKTFPLEALRLFAIFDKDLGRDFPLPPVNLVLTLKADGKDFLEESFSLMSWSSLFPIFLWSYHLQKESTLDCQNW